MKVYVTTTLIVLVIFCFIVYARYSWEKCYTIGYRQGQIDALTKKPQYELVTMPDSTRAWKRIGAQNKRN
jgi:hypothetical protein